MRLRLPERDLARVVVLQACADTLMPALPIRAAEERAAGNEALTRSFETSGAQGNMSKVSRSSLSTGVPLSHAAPARCQTAAVSRFWS